MGKPLRTVICLLRNSTPQKEDLQLRVQLVWSLQASLLAAGEVSVIESTPAPPPPPPGLLVGAIVGIVLGVLGGVALCGGLTYFIMKKMKDGAKTAPAY